MLFEIITTIAFGGLGVYGKLKQTGDNGNDSDKINKIFSLSGLNVKDGKETKTAQLVSKKRHSWGMEYKYRIPLGRSFSDYEGRLDALRDGLNNRRVRIKLQDLKSIEWNKNLIQSIKKLTQNKLSKAKEIELFYDGLLHVMVYNNPMPTELNFDALQCADDWRVPLGVDRSGGVLKHDFEKFPHVCFGGATTYGKSNLLNLIINSLLLQQPNNVSFTLIDLKGGVELCDYEYLKQTKSIAYEPEEALQSLQKAYTEMKVMQERLKKLGKKKVWQAGIKERHFIIIDEVGELNPAEAVTKEEKALKIECQRYMSQIARIGASLGFRLLLATQYPTGDVIPRQCKQNSDTKICFRVQNGTASNVVLDSGGAEQLPEVKGRAIYQKADKRIVIQSYLINTEVIEQATAQYIGTVSKREVVEFEPAEEKPKGKKPSSKPEAGANTIVIEETNFSD